MQTKFLQVDRVGWGRRRMIDTKMTVRLMKKA